MKSNQIKQRKDEVVDLASLIKQERRMSQTNNQANNNLTPQMPQLKYQSNDYQTLKTQYTTQYQSNKKANKNLRSYRQQINFVKYDQYPKQFLAYTIVSKQSTFGIFNDERLLILDSRLKQLKYYSELPVLPIQNINFTKEQPKQIIKIDKAIKFTFMPVKNGVGQVIVSWNQAGAKKQWNLTMGCHRVASEFANIINQVRINEHLKQKSIQKTKPTIKIQNKINKQVTPFISQIKKIEQQQIKNDKNKSMISSSGVNNSLPSPKNSISNSPMSNMNSPKNASNDVVQATSPKNRLQIHSQNINISAFQGSITIQNINSPKNKDKVNSPSNNAHSNKNDFSSNDKFNAINSPKNNMKSPQIIKNSEVINDNLHKNQIINDSSIHFIDSNIVQNLVNSQTTNHKDQNITKIEMPVTVSTNAEKQKSPKVESINKSQNIWLKQDRIVKPKKDASIKNQLKIQSPKTSKMTHQKQVIVPNRQIKIQEIIRSANDQFRKQSGQNMQTNSKERSSKERLSYLQNILSNRKPVKQSSKQRNNSISQSKVLVKKYQTPKTLKSPKIDLFVEIEKSDKNVQKVETQQKKNVKKGYSQKYECFRQSLLAERTNAAHKVINLNKNSLPKRQSTSKSKNQRYSYSNSSKRQSIFTNKSSQEQSWFIKWINSSTQRNLGETYNNFYNQCVNKVKRLTSKFSQWHLTHKIGNQFILQQNCIQYKYYTLANTDQSQIHHCQMTQTQKMYNFNYLFKFIKKSYSNNQISVIVPLTCIIDYKGLKVFCRAMVSSDLKCSILQDIKDYIPVLKQLQKECRLSLFKCQLYQIFHKDRIIIYMQELDFLPKIGQNTSLLVDPKYIQQYIVNGIIASQSDLLEINKHLQSSIFKKFLKHLNQTHILSNLELNNILHTYGLNQTFLPVLYERATSFQYNHAKSLIFCSIIANILQRIFRQIVHTKIIKKQISGTLQQCFLNAINKWSNKDEEVQLQMIKKLKIILKLQSLTLDKSTLDNSYILSSLFISLGLNCDFKYKINTSELQRLSSDMWINYKLNQQQINLYFIVKRTIYDYHHFNISKILYNSIFNLNFTQNYQNIKSQTILGQLNHDKNNPYYQSYLFQLLPIEYKVLLNYYLAHVISPNKVINHHSFEHQFQYLYFNLYKHSTSLILNYYHFAQDFIGIKWLIKHKQFTQADVKISEMRQRVYIWAKKCPKILMDLNDLQALYSLKLGKFGVAMQKSLLSLQVAIHYFGRDRQEKWQVIWQKSFLAGNIHFKLNKFQEAFDFYEICTDLIQKLNDMQLNDIQISQQFLQIYNKKATIYFNLGKTKQTSLLIHQNLQKLQKWKTLFTKQSLKLNLIRKIMKEQYNSYCLLFRVLQLQKERQLYYETLTLFIDKYIQKDIKFNIKNKITIQNKQKMRDVIKYMWSYIMMDLQQVNIYLSLLNKKNVNIYVIETTIKKLYRQNRQDYIYTMEEMYRYIHQLFAFKKQKGQLQTGLGKVNSRFNKSCLLLTVIETLEQLSNPFFIWKRCKLYDEQSRSNALFILQAIVHIIGYEYSLGVIRNGSQSYQFQF